MTVTRTEVADIIEWLTRYEGEPYHALLTDPPYHLTTITKRFGKPGSAPAKEGTDGLFARASRGFMGQCYDAETEVLTEDGWRNIAELTRERYRGRAYTLNMETQEVELSRVVGHYANPEYRGKLLHFQGRSLDLLVTPEHRLVVCAANGKLAYREADDTTRALFMAGCLGENTDTPETIMVAGRRWPTEAFLRFVGVFLGDGCVVRRKAQPKKGDYICIAAFIGRKKVAIASILRDLGLHFQQSDRATHVYDGQLEDWLEAECGAGASNKRVPPELWSVGRRGLEALWNGLLSTDGHVGKGRRTGTVQFFTTSESLADDVQRLLFLIGKAGTIGVRDGRPGKIIAGRGVKIAQRLFTVSALKPNKRLFFESVDHKSGKRRLIESPCKTGVYDLTVEENHTIYVRRNGRAVWSSNSWDGGDIAFQPETWAAFLPHLHPGAFGMAFASSRGWHRLACAIEDAGFIIHPSIFLWNYGQGFPKATRIDNQVDRRAGAEREVVGTAKGMGKQNPEWNGTAKGRKEDSFKPEYEATAATTDLAKAWEHHRYGLQALKPAAEPIIVFQKPYEGRPVDDITRTGAGALNIDASRVGMMSPEEVARSGKQTASAFSPGGVDWKDNGHTPQGRWPANFALVHHPDCGEQCVEGCPVRSLDGQAIPGMHASGQASVSRYGGEEGPASISVGSGGGHGYGNETPSPSRFFHSGDWQAEALEQADPVLYAAKASVSEREAGLHLDGSDGRRCTHPTVKPIALARWLATLLLPPEQYAPRRILIPFSGVASEMIGAGLAGWEHVQGVELSKEYAELGAIRLEWWLGRGWQIPLFGG